MYIKVEIERRERRSVPKRRWTPPAIAVVKEASDATIAGGTADDGGLLFQS